MLQLSVHSLQEFKPSRRVGNLLQRLPTWSPKNRALATTLALLLLLMSGQAECGEAKSGEDQKQLEPGGERSVRNRAKPFSARLSRKLQNLIVPRVAFNNSTVFGCVEFLRKISSELDTTDPDPITRGIAFVLLLDEESLRRAPRVRYHAENVRISDALDEIMRQTNLDYQIAQWAIEIGGPRDFWDELAARYFSVPSALFPECQSTLHRGSELAEYVRLDVRERLGQWGIALPSEGAAYYFPATLKLWVRANPELLESLDGIVQSLVAQHPFPPEEQILDTRPPGIGPEFGVRPVARRIMTGVKLQRIILHPVEIRRATIEEALDLFIRKTVESDVTEPEEAKKGIRGSLEPNAVSSGMQPEITISLPGVPALDALAYIAKLAKLEYTIQDDGSLLIHARSTDPQLQTRTYHVPTQGIHLATGTIAGPDGVTYASVQELFTAFGVHFPGGGSVGLTTEGDIVMRNTDRNLAVADVLVAALIDSREEKLTDVQLSALRSIIADAQEHGQIRPPPALGFGEG